ncbi:MAG: hypothetical protein OEY89_03395 [Gammaproteobacteria bacterium]|nr:hypothetical protein [Gammaproteobacteria bacterium]
MVIYLGVNSQIVAAPQEKLASLPVKERLDQLVKELAGKSE